jgi:ABC-type dipeptide/oligopeptide/nickel transport system permease subunit
MAFWIQESGADRGWRVRKYLQNKAGVFGLVIFSLVLFTTFFGPLFYPINPFEMVGKRFLPPGGSFPLGTDYLGGDVPAGIVHGAKTSFFVGIMAAVVMMTIGILFGALAGYRGILSPPPKPWAPIICASFGGKSFRMPYPP